MKFRKFSSEWSKKKDFEISHLNRKNEFQVRKWQKNRNFGLEIWLVFGHFWFIFDDFKVIFEITKFDEIRLNS